MPGGSQEIIDAGCLENETKNSRTHLWSGYPTGTIHSRAQSWPPDEFSVTIKGRGHGAKPHDAPPNSNHGRVHFKCTNIMHHPSSQQAASSFWMNSSRHHR